VSMMIRRHVGTDHLRAARHYLDIRDADMI